MDSSIFYENLRTRLSERIGPAGAQSLESLGLLDDVEIVKCGTPLDTVSHYLSKRLQLRKFFNSYTNILEIQYGKERTLRPSYPADCVPTLLSGYAVEPLMPDRSKVRFQTKRDTGVCAVRGRSRFASGTCLLIRRACASEPETA